MNQNVKLLVMEAEKPQRDGRLGFKIERSKALNAISLSGAKVSHDSGGRLIIIEVPEEGEKALIERLPGARLVPIDSDVRNLMADLDSTESLFLDALRIRTSENYRDAKKQRKYGETPEERALTSAPCVRDEY